MAGPLLVRPRRLIGPRVPLDRRALVRGAGRGSLAAGLLAGGLGAVGAAARPAGAPAGLRQRLDCPALTFVSRVAVEVRSDVQCAECECQGNLSYTLAQRFSALLKEADCDELAKLLDGEWVLEASVTRRLRLPGPCGSWAGHHAGEFELVANGELAFTGELHGSDGIVADEVDSVDCCRPERGAGALLGRGVGRWEGCELVASYRSRLPAAEPDRPPCDAEQWVGWELALVGAIACPCDPTVPPPDCVDFTQQAPGTYPNPLDLQGVTFELGGATDNRIDDAGTGFVGLHAGDLEEGIGPLVISGPTTCRAVELVVAAGHRSLISATGQVDQDTNPSPNSHPYETGSDASNPETIVFTGAIEKVVVEALENELVVLKYCCTPS